MKIVHVYHHYHPVVGGLERAVQNIAEELARLGHEIHVVASKFGAGDRPEEEVVNGIHVHRVKGLRLHYPDLTYPLEYPDKVFRDADIVHGHSQNSLFVVKIVERAKKFGVKTLIHFMAVDAFKDHPNFFIRLLAPYYGGKNTKVALKIADLPLVRSIRDLEILKRMYGVEAKYLPDAVPDYYFTAEKSNPDKFREKFGIKQGKFFLFIGRMHKLKGPQILVGALKYADEDIAAVFIGPDGGYLRKTLNLAGKIDVKRRVYYLGYVDEKTKIEALDSATALVLPSLADYVEVYPMVISEAWAREKPVIASSVGGIPYRVKHGINGLLVNPSDPKMLAEAMLKLASEEGLAEEMGRNGRKEVLSWREVAEKSIQLYKQVLERRIR
ncbi:MAG: glycosyltransferase family 4 protein [archaeon YNP-WB-062]|jgi:glycosyltransferase involved in cell wall biosynthesis|nr:glycosyltransferase family 4 protein [Candidatus Culexarchaeum yellowstonense]